MLALFSAVGTAAPRSVLLIISDDQGLDLGAYGNTVLRTPILDGLAARGTLFTNAFATVSSCSPSRSVIYSGLYSHSNGMYGLAHDVHNQHYLPWVRTLPQMLKAAGYTTALVGKKHILPESALPFDAELAPEKPGIRDVAFMADEARKFISASAGKPFLMIVGFSDPHRAAENFGNTQDWPSIKKVTYDPKKIPLPAHLPDVPEVRKDLADYYESISRLDSGIGLLLDGLQKSGRAADTLVIFLSDNGRPFPGAKTTLYDEGIHLPLIVASPTQTKRAVKNEAMVSWVDITPTILDWAGVPAPKEYKLQGRSLLAILEQSQPTGWDRVFASHGFHEINQYYPMRALRTRQYKYIANLASPLPFPVAGDIASSATWHAIEAKPSLGLGSRSLDAFLHRPAEELYDLSKDPNEVRNLANDPAHKEIVQRMRAEMTKFQKETHDPWLPGTSSPFGHH
ncbi:sulfatase [Steroidobacter flavus]|uniref:sulfatase family protein n=1 Tax=Steroidobacter flavus TaxID=1842136 RepID=UPI0036D3BDB7